MSQVATHPVKRPSYLPSNGCSQLCSLLLKIEDKGKKPFRGIIALANPIAFETTRDRHGSVSGCVAHASNVLACCSKFVMASSKVVEVGGRCFQLVRKLGQGGQATLFLARSSGGFGEEFFVIKQTCPKTQQQMDVAQKEIALCRSMVHPNIVGYVADSIEESVDKNGHQSFAVLLVTEYYAGGNLFEATMKRREAETPFTEKEVFQFGLQIARALEYLHMHSPPVAHRDLKLENILLGVTGRVALCDFGSCTTERTRCETKEDRIRIEDEIARYTSPSYRSPETCDLFSGKELSEKMDIWAFGCLVYALAYGKHAFDDGSTLGILSGKVKFPELTSEEGKETKRLIKWCLDINPDQRPQIGDVLDFIEEVLRCREGPSASERGSGIGARPAAFSKLDSSETASVSMVRHASWRSSKGSEGSDVCQQKIKSELTSSAARQRLLARKNSSQSMVASKEKENEEFDPFSLCESQKKPPSGLNEAFEHFDPFS